MFKFLDKLDNLITHIEHTNNMIKGKFNNSTQKRIISNLKYLKNQLNEIKF